jgi:hypothetical protein
MIYYVNWVAFGTNAIEAASEEEAKAILHEMTIAEAAEKSETAAGPDALRN